MYIFFCDSSELQRCGGRVRLLGEASRTRRIKAHASVIISETQLGHRSVLSGKCNVMCSDSLRSGGVWLASCLWGFLGVCLFIRESERANEWRFGLISPSLRVFVTVSNQALALCCEMSVLLCFSPRTDVSRGLLGNRRVLHTGLARWLRLNRSLNIRWISRSNHEPHPPVLQLPLDSTPTLLPPTFWGHVF